MTEAIATRERYSCGARAAFCLLRMLGREATYSSVCDQMQVSETGTNIEDVCNALRSRGLQCAARRLQLTDLSSLPVPFNLHVMPNGTIDGGHFIIVTNVGQGGLYTYDPVTNKREHPWRWRSISDWWSGYVIVPISAHAWNCQPLLLCVLAVHLCVAILAVVALVWNTWRTVISFSKRRHSVVGILTVISVLMYPLVGVAKEQLRSSRNDGANAVAILGGLCNVVISPGVGADAERIHSLGQIQSRLQAHGVAASVRFLGYHELADLNRPCIVPLMFSNHTMTTLCIFVQANDSDVFLVEAGPLVARQVSVDDFRRYWTGYAVFGNVPQIANTLSWRVAILGFWSPVCIYLTIANLRRLRDRRRLRTAAK